MVSASNSENCAPVCLSALVEVMRVKRVPRKLSLSLVGDN